MLHDGVELTLLFWVCLDDLYAKMKKKHLHIKCNLHVNLVLSCYFQKHEDESESWLHRQVR